MLQLRLTTTNTRRAYLDLRQGASTAGEQAQLVADPASAKQAEAGPAAVPGLRAVASNRSQWSNGAAPALLPSRSDTAVQTAACRADGGTQTVVCINDSSSQSHSAVMEVRYSCEQCWLVPLRAVKWHYVRLFDV